MNADERHRLRQSPPPTSSPSGPPSSPVPEKPQQPLNFWQALLVVIIGTFIGGFLALVIFTYLIAEIAEIAEDEFRYAIPQGIEALIAWSNALVVPALA